MLILEMVAGEVVVLTLEDGRRITLYPLGGGVRRFPVGIEADKTIAITREKDEKCTI